MRRVKYVIGFCMLFIGQLSASELFESSYSPVDEQSCKTISIDEPGISVVQRCPDFGEYGVLALEGDLRQSITLLRDGVEHPLEFWRTVTPHWSSLGKLAEWRHHKGDKRKVFAMIVRLNVSENPDTPEKMTSYLVVTKITETGICVVGRIAPQKDGSQNLQAREMADFSAALPCIGSERQSSR